MVKKIQKPVSILLAVLMVAGLLAVVPLTAGAETVVSYYVVGTMTGWQPQESYLLVRNTAAQVDEYMLKDVALHAEDAIKVTGSDRTAWFPGGADNDYVIQADGTYDIYFRPNYDGNDDWYYNCLYVVKQVPQPLFAGHTVTLDGDIGINFFIDSNAADFANAQTATVIFTWDEGEYAEEYDLKAMTPDNSGMYRATVNVVAAQMAHKIQATVTIDGAALNENDLFSVQDYAEELYNNPTAYDSEKPEQLKALAAALLHYGAQAQTVFADVLKEHPAPADSRIDAADYNGVDGATVQAAIRGEASDLETVAPQFGAKYYTNSLLYLSQNTLRLYFTKNDESFDPAAFDGSLSDYYYYVQKADIPAAELDDLQDFEINGVPFSFSALDYVKAILDSSNMTDTQKDLAKALFLYNQAANNYFDMVTAPVERIVDLNTLTADYYEAQSGETLTGALAGNKKITIAAGATVTLRDVTITSLENDANNAGYAGITPLGDATILLEGVNTVTGGYEDYPGIYAPENATLTIGGTGSLTVASNGYGCGIGGGQGMEAGNIVINGGNISCSSNYAAAIGSGSEVGCGSITINGGAVTANGGYESAGIGTGYAGVCGDITIISGTVTAKGGTSAAAIGTGYDGHCGHITITNTVTMVTATKGAYSPYTIGVGSGESSTCGTLTIGGTVFDPIAESPYTFQYN